jgi:hypothetical protein
MIVSYHNAVQGFRLGIIWYRTEVTTVVVDTVLLSASYLIVWMFGLRVWSMEAANVLPAGNFFVAVKVKHGLLV